jgi:hypothetical protein
VSPPDDTVVVLAQTHEIVGDHGIALLPRSPSTQHRSSRGTGIAEPALDTTRRRGDHGIMTDPSRVIMPVHLEDRSQYLKTLEALLPTTST